MTDRRIAGIALEALNDGDFGRFGKVKQSGIPEPGFGPCPETRQTPISRYDFQRIAASQQHA
jgi:hypothetical protein